jgi:hypothetical protein
MVKKVEAWRDGEGKVHETRLDAVRADAYNELVKIGEFNHATISAMLKYRATIVEALSPIDAPETANAQHG